MPRACAAHRSDEKDMMMNYDGMMDGGMWGMGLVGLLILVLVVLGIAALIKYLRR